MNVLVDSNDLPSVERALETRGACGAKATAGAMAEEQIAAIAMIFFTIFDHFNDIVFCDPAVTLSEGSSMIPWSAVRGGCI